MFLEGGLSENTCRRIALLGHVPPFPTLSFVVHSGGKAEVLLKILSENLWVRKVGKRDGFKKQ